MTETARDRLVAGWGVDPERVTVITPRRRGQPHRLVRRRAGRRAPRPAVLTWGLLGEGKGIEWALRALAELRDLDPRCRSTASSGRPTRGCSSARARPTATGSSR